MAQRNDHAQLLLRLRLMYQDARRSAELRDQEAGAIRRRIVGLRGGYRRAARPTLLARLAVQADQNVADLARCVGAAEAPEDSQGPSAHSTSTTP